MSGKDSPPVAILSVLRLVVGLNVDKHRSLNKHAYACDEISHIQPIMQCVATPLACGHSRFQRSDELGDMTDHLGILLVGCNAFHDGAANDDAVRHF